MNGKRGASTDREGTSIPVSGRSRNEPSRVSTGVPGLDEITAGGLPRVGVTVVLGGAGAGKTIFALQALASGGRCAGERGILVAFEESAAHIVANAAGFDWASDAFEAGAIVVLDAQLTQTVERGGEFDLIGLLATVAATAERIGAVRVVFDGLDVLLAHLGDAALVRRETFRLREWAHQNGISAIVTAKADASDVRPTSEYAFLQFMADCVVTLYLRMIHGRALRFVRVAKYRGAAHSANEFPITIGEGGLEVAGNASLALDHAASSERISTGIERLDSMLNGGIYRGSSVLITGVPGTAKTTLAAAFAGAAAARGERTVYVSFDEAPEQLLRNVASVGLRLRPHVDSGALILSSSRGRSESPEAQVARVRGLLRRLEPRNLVIDPLSALTQPGGESYGENAAIQIIELAKREGITIVSTSLLGGAQPLSEETPLNVSTVADTWLHVSYVSQGGERNRAITMIKSRGTGHSNQVRELVLADTGVTLADVYTAGGEVLMGTLRWEKENEAREAEAAARAAARLRERKAELALAETQAQIDQLVRERDLREAELASAKASASAELDQRSDAATELLHRRRADLPGPLPEPAT
jgi:circadian clock protein KaiC